MDAKERKLAEISGKRQIVCELLDQTISDLRGLDASAETIDDDDASAWEQWAGARATLVAQRDRMDARAKNLYNEAECVHWEGVED